MTPTSPPLLDTPLVHVMADQVQFDRLLTALEAHSDMTYVGAVDRVLQAVRDAAQRTVAPGQERPATTLRALMPDLPLDEIAQDLRVLERRDAAGRKFTLDAELPLQAALDAQGMVPFKREHADEVGRIMTDDPATQAGRFFRARTAGHPVGDQGAFNEQDKFHTANGHDMVLTLEAHAEARKTAARRLAALDEKLVAAPDPAARLRILDAEPASYLPDDPDYVEPGGHRLLRRMAQYMLERPDADASEALTYALEHADEFAAEEAAEELARRTAQPAPEPLDDLALADAKARKMMLDNDAHPSAYAEYLKAAVDGREIAA